jgi:hypothetical protein
LVRAIAEFADLDLRETHRNGERLTDAGGNEEELVMLVLARRGPADRVVASASHAWPLSGDNFQCRRALSPDRRPRRISVVMASETDIIQHVVWRFLH